MGFLLFGFCELVDFRGDDYEVTGIVTLFIALNESCLWRWGEGTLVLMANVC